MKVLELFCGTKSISKVFKERGHETFTVDFDEQFKPDLCVNILDFNIKMLPKKWRKPTVIWASPPCQTFSVMSISKYWNNGRPKHSKTYIGLAIAQKTVEIINELKPNYWFIENPVGMLRKQRFMENLKRNTVTYCKYGLDYRKPTDIWNNANGWISKKCNVGDGCHTKVERGERKGVQGIGTDIIKCYNWDGSGTIKRAIIPPNLCSEIVDVCEGKLKEVQQELKGVAKTGGGLDYEPE